MKLHFEKSLVDISLNNNPLTQVIQGMYRHLQHVPISFKPWDNPYYLDIVAREQLVEALVKFGHGVGVDIDYKKCLEYNQDYFNKIHKIYEQNYNGNPAWLDFHEHIHMCERISEKSKILVIDYREKSGLLEKKFDPTWMKNTTTKIQPGDVFIKWAELGKTPYMYWKNSEPSDIKRLCELAKPWLKLRPRLSIALEDIDFIKRYDVLGFNQWWKDYEQAWCQHWNIVSWSIQDMASVSVIGHVDNIDLIKLNLQQEILPTRIEL